MKITLYTNYLAISGVDIKYTFDLETLQGTKEFVDYEEGEMKTDIITEKDKEIIQAELNNIEFQQKIQETQAKNKKSIKLSAYKSPEKQFNEKLEGAKAKLEKDFLNMLSKIEREVQYPFQYDNLLIIKDKINNNKFFKDHITAEQLQLLESKIEQAKRVKKEYEYKHEVIFSVKQDNNNSIFCYMDSSGYYYLVTQRQYKTKAITELFRQLLTQEGYIITDNELTLLDYYIYRETKKNIEITRIELERMRQEKQMPCIIYQETEDRILKKIFDPLLISKNYNDIITAK
jgi:hypothetical protein